MICVQANSLDILACLDDISKYNNILLNSKSFNAARKANNDLIRCKNWLTHYGIEYWYDGNTKRFRLKEDACTQDSVHPE